MLSPLWSTEEAQEAQMSAYIAERRNAREPKTAIEDIFDTYGVGATLEAFAAVVAAYGNAHAYYNHEAAGKANRLRRLAERIKGVALSLG